MQLYELDMIFIEVNFPSRRTEVTAEEICVKYTKLDSVTKDTKKSGATCTNMRTVRDIVIENMSSENKLLQPDECTVHKKKLSSNIVKLQNKIDRC